MLLNGNYSHNNISNREFNSLNTKALYQDILFPRILLLKQISFDTKLGGLDNLTLVSLLSSVSPYPQQVRNNSYIICFKHNIELQWKLQC